MQEFPLVIVTWNDAWGNAHEDVNPQDVAEGHKPTVMQTVGWLLREDDLGVSLFVERAVEGSYRGRTFIPKAMIKEIKPVIKPRKPRPPKEATN